MELEAKKRNLTFLTAMSGLYSMWKIYVDEKDFIELAYPIWRSIGNIATIEHSFLATVPEDGVIQLPDGCEFVVDVTSSEYRNVLGEDNSELSYYTSSRGQESEMTPDKHELSATSASKQRENYDYGERVNFDLGDGYIRITSSLLVDYDVTIVYKAIDTDEDGLPLLNDKEVTALTYNVALILAQRDLFAKIQGAADTIKMLQPLAERALVAAKMPETISDAALDKVLDIKTNRDFKQFGSTMKFG